MSHGAPPGFIETLFPKKWKDSTFPGKCSMSPVICSLSFYEHVFFPEFSLMAVFTILEIIVTTAADTEHGNGWIYDIGWDGNGSNIFAV